KPGTFYKLTHRWGFLNVTPGTVSLTYEGSRPGTSNDNFQFGWNTDPNKNLCQTVSGALINSSTESSQSASMGVLTTSSDVGLCIWDTQGNPDTHQDTVSLDYLAVVTSPTDTCPSMDYSTSPGRIVTGSVGDVCSSDNTYEQFEETGNPSHVTQVW